MHMEALNFLAMNGHILRYTMHMEVLGEICEWLALRHGIMLSQCEIYHACGEC